MVPREVPEVMAHEAEREICICAAILLVDGRVIRGQQCERFGFQCNRCGEKHTMALPCLL